MGQGANEKVWLSTGDGRRESGNREYGKLAVLCHSPLALVSFTFSLIKYS